MRRTYKGSNVQNAQSVISRIIRILNMNKETVLGGDMYKFVVDEDNGRVSLHVHGELYGVYENWDKALNDFEEHLRLFLEEKSLIAHAVKQ